MTGAFSSFPFYIGKLSFQTETISYRAEPLAIDQWVQNEQINDFNLLHYQQYMTTLFNTASRQMAFQEMIKGNWYQKNLPILEEVADYVAQANLTYFSGVPFNPTHHFSNDKITEIKQFIEQNATPFFKEYMQHIENNLIDYTKLDHIFY